MCRSAVQPPPFLSDLAKLGLEAADPIRENELEENMAPI